MDDVKELPCACGRYRRAVGQLVCRNCWADLPRDVKDRFRNAPHARAKRAAMSEIVRRVREENRDPLA